MEECLLVDTTPVLQCSLAAVTVWGHSALAYILPGSLRSKAHLGLYGAVHPLEGPGSLQLFVIIDSWARASATHGLHCDSTLCLHSPHPVPMQQHIFLYCLHT